MAEKTLKARVVQKHDTEANWNKATNFIPKAGEICVYSDINKMKVGDGATLLTALPFFDDGVYKEYKDQIVANSSNSDVGSLYFGEIIPITLNDEWYIHYQIFADIPNHANASSFHDVKFIGSGATLNATSSLNGIKNTSYRAFYNHCLRYVNSTGFAAGHGHLLGVGFMYAWNATNASYKRTFKIRILETRNCNFKFMSTPAIYSAISWYNSGKSYGGTFLGDAYDNGLRHTGDNNDIYNLYDYGAFRVDEGWSANSFVGLTAEGKYTRIINADGTLGTKAFSYRQGVFHVDVSNASNTTYGVWAGTKWLIRTSGVLPSAAVAKYNLRPLLTTNIIYIKCSRSTPSTFLPVDVVKALPTSADGYFYYQLGKPYQDYADATGNVGITINPYHPIYYYDVKENAIRSIELENDASGNVKITGNLTDGTNSVAVKDIASKSFVEGKGYLTSSSISGKLDKVTGTTTYPQVYVKNADGTQGIINAIADQYSANSIVRRDSKGEIAAHEATAGGHAVNLSQLQSYTASVNTKISDNLMLAESSYRITDNRRNKFTCIPADQIIVEKSTDGGTTWVSAGLTDDDKRAMFTGANTGRCQIPLINGKENTNALLRITVTAQKYNVPAGTAETEKYNYWRPAYYNSGERYCNLNYFYFWICSYSNRINIEVYKALASAPDTWIKFGSTNASGWSGGAHFRTDGTSFGGAISQRSQPWSFRFVFRTSTTAQDFDNSKINNYSSAQSIMSIRAFGNSEWGETYITDDHLGRLDSHYNFSFYKVPVISPSNGNSTDLGWSGAQFKNIYAQKFYENGTALSSKYEAKGANSDLFAQLRKAATIRRHS